MASQREAFGRFADRSLRLVGRRCSAKRGSPEKHRRGATETLAKLMSVSLAAFRNRRLRAYDPGEPLSRSHATHYKQAADERGESAVSCALSGELSIP